MTNAYRDVTAEQKIADLEAALLRAQDKTDEALDKVSCLKRQRLQAVLEVVANPFWWAIFIVIVFSAAGVFKAAVSDGKIDYCYVDTGGNNSERRTLYGHRPWRMDASLKSLPAAEDPAPLFALAKEIGCPVR